MESSASAPKSSGPSKRNAVTRRSWTPQEEAVLVAALKDIVLRGWKADNGFKSGYQGQLEQAILKAFPGTDIRATPHINSKIHVWKKDYGSLASMLSRSGFGWNDAANMIDVYDDNTWNEYVKLDANAKGMRFKSWPLYKDWCEIFGKDRATGENAETFADVIQEVLGSDLPTSTNIPQPTEGNQNVLRPEGGPSDTADTGSSIHRGVRKLDNRKSKRKKMDDHGGEVENRFLDLMTSFFEKTNVHLGELANSLRGEQEAAAARKLVDSALQPLPFLSVEQKIAIGTRLCSKPQELDYFFSLNDSDRSVMVKMLLEGKLNM